MKAGTSSLYSYTDRQGKLQLPFDEALDLSRKFCAAEPSAVLVGVESTEREWAEKARTPGDEYIVPLLNEFRTAWALIRQWTGHDPAIAAREATIQKLARLVWDAIYALQKAGLDSEAARLRRGHPARLTQQSLAWLTVQDWSVIIDSQSMDRCFGLEGSPVTGFGR